jgi:hypothetical protein
MTTKNKLKLIPLIVIFLTALLLLGGCKEPVPIALEVTTDSKKIEILEGEKLDLTAFSFFSKLNDGTKVAIDTNQIKVSGFNSNLDFKSDEPVVQTITFNYKGFTFKFDVHIIPKQIKSVSVLSGDAKTRYLIGDTINISGILIYITYEDSSMATVPLTINDFTNYDSLPLDNDSKFTTFGTYELNVKYRNISASNSLNILVDKHPQLDESVVLVRNETVVNPDKTYNINTLPNLSTIEISPLANGEYKIIPSKDGKFEMEDLREIPYQDSPIFTNLAVDQEYTIIAHQKETDFYNAGKTYSMIVVTPRLETPQPEIVSFGYNFIEIRKENKYVVYTLNHYSRMEDLGETIKLVDLEPNQEYVITAKYVFEAEKGKVLESRTTKTLQIVDNPFDYALNQKKVYNNTALDYELVLKEEFKNSGNIITRITYNNSVITPVNVGVYQVEVKHRFSPNVLRLGTLEILPRPVVINIDNLSKFYYDPDPVFTISTTSELASGHELSDFNVSLTRQLGDKPGTYQIFGTVANANYQITIIPGNLTINKKKIMVKVNDIEKTYGSALPRPTYSFVDDAPLFYPGHSDIFLDSYEYQDSTVLSDIFYPRGYYENYITLKLSNPYYEAEVINKGNILINPRDISIAINSATKQYGDLDPLFTYQIDNDNFKTQANIVLSREPGLNVGEYNITVSSYNNQNFVLTVTNSAKLTIIPRVITYQINNISVTYGTNYINRLQYTLVSGSLASGDTINEFEINHEPLTNLQVDTYDLVSTMTNPNYNVTVKKGKLTVTQKDLKITPIANQSKTYGEDDPLFDYDVSGLISGDSINIELSRKIGEDVGNYQYVLNADGSNPNYRYILDVTVGQNDVFTVKSKVLKITPEHLSKNYTEIDPILSFTTDGLVNESDLEKKTGALYRAQGEAVGTYQIYSNNLTIPNYQLVLTHDKFVINPKPITINYNLESEYTYGDVVNLFNATAELRAGDSITLEGFKTNVGTYNIYPVIKNQSNQVVTTNYNIENPYYVITIKKAKLIIEPTNATKVFGSLDPQIGFNIVSGLKSGDTKQVVSGSLTREPGEIVKEENYQIYSSNLFAVNYEIEIAAGKDKFTITPKVVTLQYKTNYTYNGKEITVEILDQNFVNKVQQTTNPAVLKDAKSYMVTFTSTDPNYQINNTNNLPIVVSKQKIKVNVLNSTKVYGTPNPDFAVDETVFADLDEVVDLSTLIISSTATATSTYGTYPITVDQGITANNYEFEFVNGILTVTPPDFNFTVNKDTYDGEPHEVTITIKNDEGDDISDQYIITATYPNGVIPTNAGSYPVNVVVADIAGVLGDVPLENIVHEIEPRELTINYNIPENYYYGDLLENPPTALDLLAGHRIELSNFSGVGTKTVTARVFDANDINVTANYTSKDNFEYTFEVFKATLTIHPQVTAKTYGTDDPTLSFYATGFKKGESMSVISGSLRRETGENVKANGYSFSLANLSADNYQFVLVDGAKFMINRLEVTVTYNLNQTYVYGDVVDLSPTANKLVEGHVISLSGYNQNAGIHKITPVIKDDTGVDVTANYSFTNPTFNLEITPATLTVVPTTLEAVYGSSVNTLNYQVSGYKYNESNLVTGNLSREAGVIAGSYELVNNLVVSSNNYIISLDEDYRYVISPKPLAFTLSRPQYVYNGKVHVLSLLTSDLVDNDAISVVNNNFVHAGTHQLTVVIKNGDGDVVTGSYTISESNLYFTIRPITITEVEWSYNNAVATATSNQLLSTDTFTYENNNLLVPGEHTATLSVSDDYVIAQGVATSFDYIHMGTITEDVSMQEVAYNKNIQKYDVTELIDKGYTVEQIANDGGKDVASYPVKLRLSKEYYNSATYETTLKIKQKEIEATNLYADSYQFKNINYLNNANISLPDGVTNYLVSYYKVVDGVETQVHEIKKVGNYVIRINLGDTNYKLTNSVMYLEVTKANLEIIVTDALLVEGQAHLNPSYEINFDLDLNITYNFTNTQTSQVSGITTGTRKVEISSIYYLADNLTDQFNFTEVTRNYTIVDKDYVKLLDYNKDELDRDEDNMFTNGLMEATKNPKIGFGYRYPNVYYSNKYVNDLVNPSFDISESTYYYKFGMANTAKIYIEGLIDFNNIDFDNVVILGNGVNLIGVTSINLMGDQIESSTRVIMQALEVQFLTPGKQTITIAYQKYDQTLEFAKLNVEVIAGFTNITKYEELFNANNQSIQNIILNNGIAYLQTLGITIKVNANSTLYGNNYEINSYSAAYSDELKPQANGYALLENRGTLDNVRIIQRKTTSYASVSQGLSKINSDMCVVFEGGVIRNSFIAYGRESIEITSTTSDLLIENSTILGGPFAIRRRSGGKLTLNNVIIIQRTDKDFLKLIAEDAANPEIPEVHKFKVNGIGMPIVFLNNSGFTINNLDIENITLEILGNTKIYSFQTEEGLMGATLPSGVRGVVVGEIVAGEERPGILQELWKDNKADLVYVNNDIVAEDPEDKDVINPAVLFVSSIDISDALNNRNPVLNFADTFKSAYKDIGLAKGYGYVYTYNKIDYYGDNPQDKKFSQTYIENSGLFNPPSYHEFTGEYGG